MNQSECLISIEFEFFPLRNKNMSVSAELNDEIDVIEAENHFTTTTKTYTKKITLPQKIKLKFNGKNNKIDTIVNKDGEIIADKHVKIKSIKLDVFECSEIFLKQKLNLITNDKKSLQTNYIGFDGIMEIDLLEDSVFKQFTKMNS